MNILIYNYENFKIDDLEKFSIKMNSTIFFATSFTEVREMIEKRDIDKVIYRICNKDDFEKLLEFRRLNHKIEFFILFPDDNKLDFNNNRKSFWFNEDAELSGLTEIFGEVT